ncbi:MAG: F0F1 ATP synthase subunit delta [Nevskiaceae bacterium]|nr:MAG: F0F1 ATP synthase subunit delta [Nevskiaceae bacterium]TBR73568.1 MAG: F0F1 ATP synthase subunit delta [Nevskiaceae bacterium]
MELSTLARPYAKAVFDLTAGADERAAWSGALQALAGAVVQGDLGRLLETPAVSREQVAGLIGDVLLAQGAKAGGAALPAEPRLRNLLRLLARNRRLRLLPVIAAEFEALRAQAEARVDVEITTAEADVPAAQRKTLEKALEKRLQRQVVVQWKSDPALVSGALIRAGDFVIDGTVRGELARLSQTLMH